MLQKHTNKTLITATKTSQSIVGYSLPHQAYWEPHLTLSLSILFFFFLVCFALVLIPLLGTNPQH